MDDNNDSIINLVDLVTVTKLANQNMSQLIQQIGVRFGAQCAISASNGITTIASSGTQVKIGSGYAISVAVITASSSTGITGLLYDSNTLIGLGSSCAIGVIPSSGTATYNWPYSNGLVVRTGSSTQVVSVSYV